MRVLVFAGLMALSSAAAAEPMLGIWATEPDPKGQVAHVSAHKCGADLCGLITQAFDHSGREIITPNVGKRLFWGVNAVSDGGYSGKAWLPSHNLVFNAKLQVLGDRMTVRGCIALICKSQVWTRVKAPS